MATATQKRNEGVVEVCCHRVRWWYRLEGRRISDDDREAMEESAEERAKELINEGCWAGDLCCVLVNHQTQREREFFGWWEIITD